jgi:hypothetical protein
LAITTREHAAKKAERQMHIGKKESNHQPEKEAMALS